MHPIQVVGMLVVFLSRYHLAVALSGLTRFFRIPILDPPPRLEQGR